jgi:hypothetical protein
MHICLKELRETAVWVRFKTGLCGHDTRLEEVARECAELMAIVGASIRTARRK